MAYKALVSIDKNIPIPCRLPKWPFREMNVGDSIFVSFQEREAAVNAAHHIGVKTDTKFSSRRLPDGARIWRIE